MVKKEKKVDYEVIYANESPKVQKLYDLYAKDKLKARILFMNDSSEYESNRIIKFKGKGKDFSIILFRKRYGIGKTNVIYNSEKRLGTLHYTKGKFLLINNHRASYHMGATISNIQTVFGIAYDSSEVLDCLERDFSWVRFIRENNVIQKVSLNTIIKDKIYSLKKALQRQYKVPYPQGKMLHKHRNMINNTHQLDFVVKNQFPYLINIESLKESWIETNNLRTLFLDALSMAKTVNQKLNCSWSDKRLKVEHDKWSEIITDVLFIDGNRPLTISPIFKSFQEFSKFEMFTTTRELALEGKKQSHCVGTYVSKVESGRCSVYTIEGHTLEIGLDYKARHQVNKIQMRGYSNCDAPNELHEVIDQLVVEFNEWYLEKQKPNDPIESFDMNYAEHLPF